MGKTRGRRINRRSQQNPVPQIIKSSQQKSHAERYRRAEAHSAPDPRPVLRRTLQRATHRQPHGAHHQHRQRQEPGIFRAHGQAAKNTKNRPLARVFRIQRDAHRSQNKCRVEAIHKTFHGAVVDRRHGSHQRGHPPRFAGVESSTRGERCNDHEQHPEGHKTRKSRRPRASDGQQRRIHGFHSLRKRGVAIIGNRTNDSIAQPHARPQKMVGDRVIVPIAGNLLKTGDGGHSQNDHNNNERELWSMPQTRAQSIPPEQMEKGSGAGCRQDRNHQQNGAEGKRKLSHEK
jgi:hypothetical protein